MQPIRSHLFSLGVNEHLVAIHSEHPRICANANKWVQLPLMKLFTFSDAKHQRKKMQMVTLRLTVDIPLGKILDTPLKWLCGESRTRMVATER